jgi:hypothetical protein
LRSSVLLRVLRLPSLVLLPASVPVVLRRAWASVAFPSAVCPPDLFAGLPGHGSAVAAPRDLANGPPRPGGAEGPHGLDRGGRPNFRGVEGRAAAYSANGYTRNDYASYDRYGHGYRYGAYAAAAAYGYGRSYATSEEGCYYVSTYRRSRRVLVCPDN